MGSSTDGTATLDRGRHGEVTPGPLGVLDPRPGGWAERIAVRTRSHHPVALAALIALVGYVLVAAILVGLGLLLTHVLLSGGLGRWDNQLDDRFVAWRTASLNTVTSIGTMIGSTGTVIAVGFAAVVVLALKRMWREIGLVVVALSVEVLVFLTVTVMVDRPRPTVPRLDPSPPTSSFPSGHTAAAIALWVSLAIVISAHVRNAFVRILVWIVALGLPIFVGLSRIYRGMHHPTDVMASIVLGAGAIATALLAVRSASAVTEIRRTSEVEDLPAAPSPVEVAR
jgi:membrane-associated phospholipid phosphatase